MKTAKSLMVLLLCVGVAQAAGTSKNKQAKPKAISEITLPLKLGKVGTLPQAEVVEIADKEHAILKLYFVRPEAKNSGDGQGLMGNPMEFKTVWATINTEGITKDKMYNLTTDGPKPTADSDTKLKLRVFKVVGTHKQGKKTIFAVEPFNDSPEATKN